MNAASWVLQMAGLDGITHSPIIRVTVAAFQRQLAKPKVKKEPITLEILRKMVETSGNPPSLSECRLLAICLLAFSAFLRFDELVKLRCHDIQFKDFMLIHITSSKTDQYRQGDEVVLARTGSVTCPVAKLEECFAMAKLSTQSSEKIFRAITATKNGEALRRSGSISYTRVWELVLEKLRSMGYNPMSFGVHSFRSGGASLAANAGVPE